MAYFIVSLVLLCFFATLADSMDGKWVGWSTILVETEIQKDTTDDRVAAQGFLEQKSLKNPLRPFETANEQGNLICL